MSYNPKIKIDVSTEVHSALRALKLRGESFDDVLKRVLADSVVESAVGSLDLFCEDIGTVVRSSG